MYQTNGAKTSHFLVIFLVILQTNKSIKRYTQPKHVHKRVREAVYLPLLMLRAKGIIKQQQPMQAPAP